MGKSVIKTNDFNLVVDGASIRVMRGGAIISNNKEKITDNIGVVSILPRAQIVLGAELSIFMDALELSRLPIALRKTTETNNYETYDILRLETGNIKEAIIATLGVYNGIVIGVIYNRSLLNDKKFRQLVHLSAMHQITICNKDDPMRLIKATDCISKLKGVPREKLIVVETARSIKVRVNYKSRLNSHLYYIFVLDKNNKFGLNKISFDLNEIGR